MVDVAAEPPRAEHGREAEESEDERCRHDPGVRFAESPVLPKREPRDPARDQQRDEAIRRGVLVRLDRGARHVAGALERTARGRSGHVGGDREQPDDREHHEARARQVFASLV